MVACSLAFIPWVTRASSRGISSNCLIFTVSTLLLLGLPCGHGHSSGHSQINKLFLDTTDLCFLLGETHLLQLVKNGSYNTTLDVVAHIQHPDVVQLVPLFIHIPCSDTPNTTVNNVYDIFAYGKSPGLSEVTFNVTPAGYVNIDTVFLRITVMRSQVINIISYVMGWIYFVTWSVSFYPQIYTNIQRKSVVGLNFDFLALNIMGNAMYSLFSCGLYFSNEIQTEYFARHPRGQNPVKVNDVFFSLHASFASIITLAHCFMYEREHQRVSKTGNGILSILTVVIMLSASLVGASYLEWLDFLYHCSYIKLSITLFKYVPQLCQAFNLWWPYVLQVNDKFTTVVKMTAFLEKTSYLDWLGFLYFVTIPSFRAYMNYKRKSTVGWSIGSVLLDFLGGNFSILQMILNSFNYNDWSSFLGFFTKFGLGIFTLIFNIIFILQHYVFYRYSNGNKSNMYVPAYSGVEQSEEKCISSRINSC